MSSTKNNRSYFCGVLIKDLWKTSRRKSRCCGSVRTRRHATHRPMGSCTFSRLLPSTGTMIPFESSLEWLATVLYLFLSLVGIRNLKNFSRKPGKGAHVYYFAPEPHFIFNSTQLSLVPSVYLACPQQRPQALWAVWVCMGRSLAPGAEAESLPSPWPTFWCVWLPAGPPLAL